MAQEEIKFSIGDNASAQSPDGANVDLIVTYDPTTTVDGGAFVVTNVAGSIQKVSASGQVVGTDQVTGLQPPSASVVTDNELFIRASPTTMPIVTSEGFAFTIDNKADTLNPAGATPGYIEFRDANGSGAGFPHTDTPDYGLSSFLDNGNPVMNFTETAVTCFVTGTLIRTTRGDVAVEALAVGDLAVTASGEPRAIRWIGHRTMVCARHARPAEVMPVRIGAHAFGPDRPARALRVSPGHAICLDVLGEILVPAASLLNSETIVQEDVAHVTYWHVELDSHDLLMAENLPTESYLEMGNRGFFADADAISLHATPDAQAKTHADFCRPFHASGPLVEAARRATLETARQHAAEEARRVA